MQNPKAPRAGAVILTAALVATAACAGEGEPGAPRRVPNEPASSVTVGPDPDARGSSSAVGAAASSDGSQGAAAKSAAAESACRYHVNVEGDTGELLFDAPPSCDADATKLFLLGDRLYWQYQSQGKSFIVSAPKQGGMPEVLVESEEWISLFDVRGSVTYRIGEDVYVIWPASSSPLRLDAPLGCTTLTSTADSVFCRTPGNAIVRWARTGGPHEVLAIQREPGRELLADPLNDQLLYDEQAVPVISRIPMAGLGSTGLEQGVIADHLRFVLNTGPGLHSLQLMPGEKAIYWMDQTSPGVLRVASGRDDRSGRTVTVQAEGLDSSALFAVMPGVGVVLSTVQTDASSRLNEGALASQRIDYTSRDRVVALAAERAQLYWLDRKGRVFRGFPRLLPLGAEDAFSSNLDSKRLSELTVLEAADVCRDLADYYRSVSSRAYTYAWCVTQAEVTSVETCEASRDRCLESGLPEWQPPFDEESCFWDLVSRSRSCDATVAYFSACFVTEAERLQRFVDTATCPNWLADTVTVPVDRSEFRECALLEQTCPPL